MADLYKDILPSLQLTKKYCLEDEKDYVAFMVNKSISHHDDGVFFASEMNRYPDLPRRAQYDFYFYALKAKRRPFVRWAKPIKIEDVELVQQYFGYNEAKARDCLNILSKDQLVMIKELLTVGT